MGKADIIIVGLQSGNFAPFFQTCPGNRRWPLSDSPVLRGEKLGKTPKECTETNPCSAQTSRMEGSVYSCAPSPLNPMSFYCG